MTGKEILAQLIQDFPKCFTENNRQPLMIGIHHGLAKIYQGKFNKRQIHTGITLYVQSRDYLTNIVEGKDRIDLNGESCDEPITAREERYAKIKLNRDSSLEQPLRALDFLKETFSGCFIRGKDKRPIALDIKKELAPLLFNYPQFDEHAIYTAVDFYTNGRVYLQSLVTDAERVNLQGKPVAKVTAHEAEMAQGRSTHAN